MTILFFIDTEHERNALMEFVYPKLREFCQKKGYDFQVICQTTIFNNRLVSVVIYTQITIG